jgi:hypothetical protein
MATKKTAAKKPAAKNTSTKVGTQPANKQRAANPRPLATPPRISVRMYRQGLGDCFLITFPSDSGRPFYMLIDSGVVLGTPDPATRMKSVVGDIARSTDSQIDLLVVTHEHWDHVSGFIQVQDLFENLKIQQVWVAWTEDPTDPLANKLRAERRTAEEALRIAVTHLALAGDTDPLSASTVWSASSAPHPDPPATHSITPKSVRREAGPGTAIRASLRLRCLNCQVSASGYWDLRKMRS